MSRKTRVEAANLTLTNDESCLIVNLVCPYIWIEELASLLAIFRHTAAISPLSFRAPPPAIVHLGAFKRRGTTSSFEQPTQSVSMHRPFRCVDRPSSIPLAIADFLQTGDTFPPFTFPSPEDTKSLSSSSSTSSSTSSSSRSSSSSSSSLGLGSISGTKVTSGAQLWPQETQVLSRRPKSVMARDFLMDSTCEKRMTAAAFMHALKCAHRLRAVAIECALCQEPTMAVRLTQGKGNSFPCEHVKRLDWVGSLPCFFQGPLRYHKGLQFEECRAPRPTNHQNRQTSGTE